MGEKTKLRDCVVTGFHDSQHRCVRDESWSLIVRPADQPSELYNLVEDPGEQHNVLQAHPEQAERLLAMLPRSFQILQPKFSTIQLQYEVSGTPVYKTSGEMRKLMRPRG